LSDASKKKRTDLKAVEDPKEALGLIKEAAKTFASTMIWTKDQKHVVNTQLNMFSDKKKAISAWIPKDVDGKKFHRDLEESGDKNCYFSVSLLRANVFFRSEFLGLDSGSFKFGLPEKVFKVQRRNDIRFVIPEGLIIKVSFQDPIFVESKLTKQVLDISASGLAFLITDVEDGLFQQEMILKDLSFTIRGKEIHCDAKIRHTGRLPAGYRQQGYRVGVKFLKLSPAESKLLTAYVFEETRKFFTRIM
jgi:hypothetical protein